MTGPGSVTISVVIPCYNAANYLQETLDSVFAQRCPAHEVIVVDDGSTDGSAELVAEYGEHRPQLRLLWTPRPSGGPSLPRNIGMAASTGDYVALLDADDLWKPDKLAHDAEHLDRWWPDVLYSSAAYFQGSPENVTYVLKARKMGQLFQLKNFVATSSICLRRGWLEESGLTFDTDPKMMVEDWHFLLNAWHGGAVMRPRPGTDVWYRKHDHGSRLERGNFDSLLEMQRYNLQRLRERGHLGVPRYVALRGLITARFWVKRARGKF
jgi:GT2 family glycosyltransferase